MLKKNHKRIWIKWLIYSFLLIIFTLIYGLFLQAVIGQETVKVAQEAFNHNGSNIALNIKEDYQAFIKNPNDFNQIDNQDIKVETAIEVRNYQDEMVVFFKHEDVIGYRPLEQYVQFLNKENVNYLITKKDGNILYQMNSTDYQSIYAYVEHHASYRLSKILEAHMANDDKGILKEKVQQGFLSFMPIDDELFIIQLDYFSYQEYFVKPVMISIIVYLMVVVVTHIAGYLWYARKQSIDPIGLAPTLKYNEHLMMVIIDDKGMMRKFNQSFFKHVKQHQKSKQIRDFLLEPLDVENQKEVFIYPTKQQAPLRFIVFKTVNEIVLFGQYHDQYQVDTYYKTLALRNKLTHIPNGLSLEEDLTNLNHQSKAGLIILDIKDFRQFKRIVGYPKANAILKAFVQVLEAELTTLSHRLYNLENDVFVIWFDELKSYQQLETWSQEFLTKFSRPFLVQDDYIKLDFKLGVLGLTESVVKKPAEEVIDVLMATLERAKKSSIYHYYVYHDQVSEYLTKQQMMERDLKNANIEKEFFVQLQPQYDLINDKVVGFEALLRWNHPLYVHESPLAYIEMAERNSMIVDIGKVVIKKVFELAMTEVFKPYKFSLNVSPYQMMQKGFIEDILELAQRYQVDTKRIAIEITETTLAQSLALMTDKLEQLKSHDFEVHLDDFGTQYSSLNYLKSLPVDVIKIDKTFVDQMTVNQADRILIGALIELMTKLNLKTIVEGVETKEQLILLKQMKADMIQGYYFSEPLSVEKAKAFISKKHHLL